MVQMPGPIRGRFERMMFERRGRMISVRAFVILQFRNKIQAKSAFCIIFKIFLYLLHFENTKCITGYHSRYTGCGRTAQYGAKTWGERWKGHAEKTWLNSAHRLDAGDGGLTHGRRQSTGNCATQSHGATARGVSRYASRTAGN